MFRSLWNRLTKFSVLGFALATISFTLGVTNWPKEELTLHLVVFAIILFVVSVFIEGYGIYKTKHFFREDAQEIYHRVTQLIMELRTLAPILHKDYGDRPDEHRRYAGDERYKKLTNKFTQTRQKCSDCRLDRKLRNLIEHEKLMAKYRLNTTECKFQGMLENADQEIRNYINTRLKMRERLQEG